jgi:eukaryotic-like serine/threonine-protein kinase
LGAFKTESMIPASGGRRIVSGLAHEPLRGGEGSRTRAAKLNPEMVGNLVIGRFRVLERVGSGGMGVVYRAFDERLQRQVAVKEIAGADASRILREAQAVARLSHPGIVTLYELGAEQGRALLVSEFVDGATLAELVESQDLSDREVAGFGADICEALEHAHARGVIHRDVKPQNVIVQVDEGVGRRAKLMDFGIASLTDAAPLTATGEVVGTLAYMAPEQAAGEPVEEPADVYSLALTLYECWTGANPVARDTPAQTAIAIGEPLESLGECRRDLPRELSACVDACLDPDPLRRPALTELREDLVRWLPTLDDAEPVHARSSARDRLRSPGALRAVQLLALCGWALVVTAISVLAGRPGLALVVGALTVPGILVASRLPWAAIPALAPALAALSAGPIYPVIAGSRGTAVERAVLGAIGWCWLVAAATAAGVGSRLGLAEPAARGWSRSTATATQQVLGPLADPQALLGAALFGIAAVLLGLVLRARHFAVALLGAVLWAAGLEAGLRAVVDGRLSGRPALLAAGAAVAVIIEFWLRSPRPQGRRVPIPGVGVPIPGQAPDAAVPGR